MYTDAPEARAPAIAGSRFFLVGLGLLTRFRAALVVGIVLPALGASGAMHRILTSSPLFPTHFHTAVDLVGIGLCITALVLSFKEPPRSCPTPTA